jgi:uncharacterized cupin superfamily protein
MLFGWRAIALDGFKTAGEFALFHPPSRSAITGDAFWGVPAGAVALMPDEKLADPIRAALSARQLLAAGVQHLLVGDGMPIFHGAWDALVAMLDARRGVLTRRVNLDELVFRGGRRDPPPFQSTFAETGLLIGAQRLGYAFGKLEQGQSYCPYHWHTQEEEAFVVWSGTPTLRTPQGTFVLRPGDVIAFPIGAAGAHRLSNEAAEPALVLLVANIDPGDVCYYPDSNKLMIGESDAIVRCEPELDYYDGEES